MESDKKTIRLRNWKTSKTIRKIRGENPTNYFWTQKHYKNFIFISFVTHNDVSREIKKLDSFRKINFQKKQHKGLKMQIHFFCFQAYFWVTCTNTSKTKIISTWSRVSLKLTKQYVCLLSSTAPLWRRRLTSSWGLVQQSFSSSDLETAACS